MHRIPLESLSKYQSVHIFGEILSNWTRTISEEITIIKEP